MPTHTQTGSILWITDSIAPEQIAPLAAWRKIFGTALRLLPPLLPGEKFDTLTSRAKAAGAHIVRLAADNFDVTALARAAKFATAASGGKSDRWTESGYWLTPLLAALLRAFFRRGWMVQTANRA